MARSRSRSEDGRGSSREEESERGRLRRSRSRSRGGTGGRTRARSREREHSDEEGPTIFLNNLPYRTDDEDVRSFLEENSRSKRAVRSARVVYGQQNREHRGYALATMRSTRDADFTISSADGKPLAARGTSHSRRITVRYDRGGPQQHSKAGGSTSQRRQPQNQVRASSNKRGRQSAPKRSKQAGKPADQAKEHRQLDAELDSYWQQDDLNVAEHANANGDDGGDTEAHTSVEEQNQHQAGEEAELEDYEA